MSVPTVDTELLEQRVGIARNAKVAIARLRQALTAYAMSAGIPPLHIHSQRAIGWWFDKPTKTRIKALVAADTAATTVDETEGSDLDFDLDTEGAA